MPLSDLFRKPKVAPPQSLKEPNFTELEMLRKKYRDAAEKYHHREIGNTQSWGRIEEAFNDVVFLNFKSISNFLKALLENDDERMAQLEKRVKLTSNYAASSAWIIGREWASRDSILKEKSKTMTKIDTDNVPADAMELLNKALYDLYLCKIRSKAHSDSGVSRTPIPEHAAH